ncbi:MAG: hypothetical protein JNM56_07860, partial [Planctomycetia bacterium]|nr:hypothetical protein [Planctomycetia bacterium]
MSSTRRICTVLVGLGLLAPLTAWPLLTAEAQVRIMRGKPGADEEGKETLTSAISLPTDRKAQQVMNKSQELIEDKDWGQAVRALQSLLDMPQDGF